MKTMWTLSFRGLLSLLYVYIIMCLYIILYIYMYVCVLSVCSHPRKKYTEHLTQLVEKILSRRWRKTAKRCQSFTLGGPKTQSTFKNAWVDWAITAATCGSQSSSLHTGFMGYGHPTITKGIPKTLNIWQWWTMYVVFHAKQDQVESSARKSVSEMSDEIKDGYVNILTTINQW